MYEYADKMIRLLNRRNLRAFNRLKQLGFDELNILQAVNETYDTLITAAKKKYRQIARESFIAALLLADVGKSKAEWMADDTITNDWVLDMLEEYDPVTLYQFLPEAERKKQRTAEAIIAAHNKSQAIDKALRLWTLQTTHYADKSVDNATIGAYKAAGVKKVMWVTAEDDRVCTGCRKLNGKVFPINKVPDKPHYHCRCYLLPVK